MKKRDYFIIIIMLIMFLLEIFRISYITYKFNIYYLVLKDLFYIIMLIYGIYINKSNCFISKYIKYLVLIFELFSLIFINLNVFGFFLFYLFIVSLCLMLKIKLNRDLVSTLVIEFSGLLLVFTLFGLLNILIYAKFFIVLCYMYLLCNTMKKHKNDLKELLGNNITKEILNILLIIIIISILGGVGRYVHSWDEYSYWGYAAKVLINENSIYKMISLSSYYPPISSILHYIVSIFSGYSESNLYIGLTFATMIYFLPALISIVKIENKITKALLFICILFAPTIFNGSINYSLIYVDLFLGSLLTSVFLLYFKSKKLLSIDIILTSIVIILLKPNGFVYISCFIFFDYLRNIVNDKITLTNIIKKGLVYLIPVIIALIIFLLWSKITGLVKSPYDLELLPDSLKNDLGPKLNGKFILDFVSNLIKSFDEKVVFSFIGIPLFVFLVFILFIIAHFSDYKNNEKYKCYIPYIFMYIVFFGITALSLFVQFSYYEATKLASFGRYLAPIHIVFVEICLANIYKIDIKKINVILLAVICVIGFSNCTYFITDIRTRRDTYNYYKYQTGIYNEVNTKTPKNAKIFVINQQAIESIMPKWYSRYYLYPRITNSSATAIDWKILTEDNYEDMGGWGLTKDTLEYNLKKYSFDYLYFYSTTEELNELLKDDFLDEDSLSCKLFKIIDDEQSIKFSCQ